MHAATTTEPRVGGGTGGSYRMGDDGATIRVAPPAESEALAVAVAATVAVRVGIAVGST